MAEAIVACACGQKNRLVFETGRNGTWTCGRCGSPITPDGASYLYPKSTRVAPGRFAMGAPRNADVVVHYAMAVSGPVTFGDWGAALKDSATLRALTEIKGAGEPATGISFDAALAYVHHLNLQRGLAEQPDRFRLPFESEWVLARRAGAVRPIEGFHEWCEPDPPQKRRNLTWRERSDLDDRFLRGPKEDDRRQLQRTQSHLTGLRLVRSLPPMDAEDAVLWPSSTEAMPAGQRFCEYDAFLSHNQRDGSIRIKQELEARGLAVWHDNDADMTSQKVKDLVQHALGNARFVCVCVGPDFYNSQWVRAEYYAALKMETDDFHPDRVLILEMRGGGPVPDEIKGKRRLPDTNLDFLAAYLHAANTRSDAGPFGWMISEPETRYLRSEGFEPVVVADLVIDATEDIKLAVTYGEHALREYNDAVVSGDTTEIERSWRKLYETRNRQTSAIALQRYTDAVATAAEESVLAQRWSDLTTFAVSNLHANSKRYADDYEHVVLSGLAFARYRTREAAGAPARELNSLWPLLSDARTFDVFKLALSRGITDARLLDYNDALSPYTVRPWADTYASDASSREGIEQCLKSFELLADLPMFWEHLAVKASQWLLPRDVLQLVEALAEVLRLPDQSARTVPLFSATCERFLGQIDRELAAIGEAFGQAMTGADAAAANLARIRFHEDCDAWQKQRDETWRNRPLQGSRPQPARRWWNILDRR